MDPRTLAILIPLFALGIGLAATILGGMVRLEKARAANRKQLGDDDLVARVQDLEDEVSTMRQQLSETSERLDFAERLLARPREDRETQGR